MVCWARIEWYKNGARNRTDRRGGKLLIRVPSRTQPINCALDPEVSGRGLTTCHVRPICKPFAT